MAKKKKTKTEAPKDERLDLLDSQIAELQKLVDGMVENASELVDEYQGDLSDAELSGSLGDLSSMITEINEDSPYLDELFKGDSWKKVLKATIPGINLDDLEENKKKDKEDDSK